MLGMRQPAEEGESHSPRSWCSARASKRSARAGDGARIGRRTAAASPGAASSSMAGVHVVSGWKSARDDRRSSVPNAKPDMQKPPSAGRSRRPAGVTPGPLQGFAREPVPNRAAPRKNNRILSGRGEEAVLPGPGPSRRAERTRTIARTTWRKTPTNAPPIRARIRARSRRASRCSPPAWWTRCAQRRLRRACCATPAAGSRSRKRRPAAASPPSTAATAPHAATLARHFIQTFEGYDYVVAPSALYRHDQVHYAEALADDPAWGERARRLGASAASS